MADLFINPPCLHTVTAGTADMTKKYMLLPVIR